jgi:flagellar hook capping protein FlgD
MRRTLSVLFVLLSMFVAADGLSAQDSGPPASSGQANGFQLIQNYPNPFNPETTIPFILGEDLFADGRPAVVSIRIYNLLSQFVASPVALGHPTGDGVEVVQLEYAQAGRFEAFWDGTDMSGRQVASGIYLLRLTVNGVSKSRKMFVLK